MSLADMACHATLLAMYVEDRLSRSQTLIHRKVLSQAIGGGIRVYADAKARPFAKLANEDLLDTSDVCRLFPCSARTIYRWMAEGSLRPLRKIGREFLFTKQELLRWWDERPQSGRPLERR